MRKTTKKTTKSAKKVVKKTTVRKSEVMVGRFGQDPVGVTVKGDSTVGAVLKKAEIALSGSEHVWVNGKRGGMTTKIKAGEIISIVSPRQAGVK